MRRWSVVGVGNNPCCGLAQPNMSVSTVGACNTCDGIMPFDSVSENATTCTWRWNAIGGCAGQQVIVHYTKATGIYSIDVSSAFGGSTNAGLSCVGGTVTGTVVLPGNLGCVGSVYTLVFG